ncbi:hypothetical protein ACFC18_54990 [Streptomyces sp. NPDC056121]|uniref:hypothetical protein n=1 Tax=unclassified Streptomyces TaxID=2593676 RepID=UPI0035E0597B
MQNGGFGGAAWNIATLAAVAGFAEWFWGAPLTLCLFAAGILLPERIDALWGETSRSTDPRNFAGSSGATYFLGATLAAALLLRGGADEVPDKGSQSAGPDAEGSADEGSSRRIARKTARTPAGKNRLLALAVPVLGPAMWLTQEKGHGLVAWYGFTLGARAWVAFRTVLRPDRDLRQPPRTTMARWPGSSAAGPGAPRSGSSRPRPHLPPPQHRRRGHGVISGLRPRR